MTGTPLRCEEARVLLDERLDRALSPAEEAALAAHLGGCSSCREEAASLARVHGALSAMAPPDPGSAFTDRVVAALDRAPAGGAARTAPAGAAPARVRLLRGLVAVAGTGAFAALALAVLPLDAAAAGAGGFVPPIPPPDLPEIPAGAADLLAGLPAFLPPWAAALGAALAAAAAAAPVAALRRGARKA